jgi:hypothetical protein
MKLKTNKKIKTKYIIKRLMIKFDIINEQQYIFNFFANFRKLFLSKIKEKHFHENQVSFYLTKKYFSLTNFFNNKQIHKNFKINL